MALATLSFLAAVVCQAGLGLELSAAHERGALGAVDAPPGRLELAQSGMGLGLVVDTKLRGDGRWSYRFDLEGRVARVNGGVDGLRGWGLSLSSSHLWPYRFDPRGRVRPFVAPGVQVMVGRIDDEIDDLVQFGVGPRLAAGFDVTVDSRVFASIAVGYGLSHRWVSMNDDDYLFTGLEHEFLLTSTLWFWRP
jgi:hypothetical protein